jgi:hypothetical protein
MWFSIDKYNIQNQSNGKYTIQWRRSGDNCPEKLVDVDLKSVIEDFISKQHGSFRAAAHALSVLVNGTVDDFLDMKDGEELAKNLPDIIPGTVNTLEQKCNYLLSAWQAVYGETLSPQQVLYYYG